MHYSIDHLSVYVVFCVFVYFCLIHMNSIKVHVITGVLLADQPSILVVCVCFMCMRVHVCASVCDGLS